MLSKANKALLNAVTKGYSIDDLGNVTSPFTGRFMTPQENQGYLHFGVAYKGSKVHVKFHKLQAYKKFGNRLFEGGQVVRHLNGDSTDNRIENIGIGTQRDNALDLPDAIRATTTLIAAKARRKLTFSLAEEIRCLYSTGDYTQARLGQLYGVSSGIISAIVNNKTYLRDS